MKSFLITILMTCLTLPALSVQARNVTGRSTLTLTPIRGNASYFVEVRTEDGKLLGHSSFGHGMVSLAQTDKGFEGWLGTGRVANFSCSQTSCQGTANSGLTNLVRTDLGNGGFKLEGRLAESHMVITRTQNKIEIYSDGSLILNRQADGTYSGHGQIGSGPRWMVDATLRGEGDLTDVQDPALLTLILATPFARGR